MRGREARTMALKTSDFDYHLPTNLIAQHPLPARDESRLLVLERSTGRIEHRSFAQLQARGQVAMGVDQYTSSHVFESLPDGGRIALERDEADPAGVRTVVSTRSPMAGATPSTARRCPSWKRRSRSRRTTRRP